MEAVHAYLDKVHDYYSKRLWAVIIHILMTAGTGGMWAVGWFGTSFVLFWLGFDNDSQEADE